LAVYIEGEFPGWHVDCEYNRQGVSRGPKQVTPSELLPPSGTSRHARISPDIVVDKRGHEGPNLLAVEVKIAKRL
jgi:hypothetical protein